MIEYLSEDNRVYVDTPHLDYFELGWDNDIVSLSKKDAKALIPILQRWTDE